MTDEQSFCTRFDEAAGNLGRFAPVLLALPAEVKARAHEIRLRAGRPLMLSLPGEDVFVAASGGVSREERPGLLLCGRADLAEIFRLLCGSSVYSHQQEIKNGFVVLRGGHRAGICGTAVLEGGRVANLRDISSVNLRVARQIRGAADRMLPAVLNGSGVLGALLFGPPGCGKTTVLRDLARQLSGGRGASRRLRVAVVDERGEIAASFGGCPQNDLDPCCDVLDGYPKGEGILQAVRALSPDVVLCDEIGSAEDASAILESLNAGVAVVASAHARSLWELLARPQIRELLLSGAFPRAVLMGGRGQPGSIRKVYEEGDYLAFENSGDAADVSRVRGMGNARLREA